MKICNICGGHAFGGGPGGRMSITGVPPRCEKCQSLERHRAYRSVFNKLIDESYKNLSFLQFSQDKTVKPEWFNSHEISIYSGENSLDLQKIERESNHYDIVMCNHVLEHVPYDNSALCELLRITKIDGFVFLTVPSPLSHDTTMDWGYPKVDQHGHYRIYGKDFASILKRYLPFAWIVSSKLIDEVTETEDIVFFLCLSEIRVQNITNKLPNTVVLQEGKHALERDTVC